MKTIVEPGNSAGGNGTAQAESEDALSAALRKKLDEEARALEFLDMFRV